MSLTIGLLISLILHSVLFYRLSSVKPIPPKPPKKQAKGNSRTKVRFIPIAKSGAKPCKKFYTGIGIMYDFLTNEVTDIALNSPASRNDIRVGDLLTNFETYKGLPIGSKVQVTIIRAGIIITKDIVINKICTTEKK